MKKPPKKVLGQKIEGAYQKYLDRPKENPRNVEIKTNIKKSGYILIPNTNILIAKQETHKGLNWEDTHYKLAENGLFMPTPAIFMPFFLAVQQASQEKTTLYDGNNNPVSKTEVQNLWKYLTTGFNGGCWTWLDAKFIEGSGALGLKIETPHRTIATPSGKRLQALASLPLESCVEEDGFVDLSFNSQGLPTRASSSNKYQQGKNIYFWHPREDRVARFIAGSGRAILYCDGGPLGSGSALGVFACAEGTPRPTK